MPNTLKTLEKLTDKLSSDPYSALDKLFETSVDLQSTRQVWEEAQSGLQVVNFNNRYKTPSGEYKTLTWCLPGLQDGIAFSVARIER
jgi:hypothetical protein